MPGKTKGKVGWTLKLEIDDTGLSSLVEFYHIRLVDLVFGREKQSVVLSSKLCLGRITITTL